MLTKLSVNLNKIALIRNSRDGNNPSPVRFGRIALQAGAAIRVRMNAIFVRRMCPRSLSF